MSSTPTAVPILEKDGAIRLDAPQLFVEALQAVLSGEWLIVAPRITVKLQKPVPVRVVCPPLRLDVPAMAVPQYWSGPFLGMRVTPRTQADVPGIRDVLERLSARLAQHPGGEIPVVSREPTPMPAEAQVGSEEPTQPSVVAPALPAQQPAAALPTPQPVQSPATEQPQGPAPEPASVGGASGELDASNIVNELLSPFPARNTGLPFASKVSFYRLLAVLYANSASGRLHVGTDQVSHVFIRRGAMLAIDPAGSTFDDYFAKVLESANVSEPDKLQEAVDAARNEGKSLALSLYEKRAITLDVLSQQLKESKLKCLAETVEATVGAQWRFEPMQKFNRRFDPIRVDLRSALVDLARRALSTQFARHLEPLLDPHRDHFPQYFDQAETPVEVLALADKEVHATQHVFTGANRLTDALAMCLLTRHAAARLVMLLDHFGMLKWLTEASEMQSGESVEEALKKSLESMKVSDHFERLEIHWASHPSQLEVAVDKARRRYGPQSSLSSRSDEAKQTCAEILVVIEESYRFLKDRKQRHQHRLEHYGEDRMRFAADFLSKQAELNFFRSNASNAIMLIESALDLVNNPAYARQLQLYKSGGRA